MSARSIAFMILLSGFVCFGMPEILTVPPGVGIVQAQDGEADGQRLVRDLEDALKSGDQARIRQAEQRVNAHPHATRIMAQRPVLKLQVKMAISQAPAATPTAQTLQSQTKQKQTLTTQTRTLQSSAGLSSASSLQGTSREGMTLRTGGLSSTGTSGAGPREIQSFASKPKGVSRESVSGVSSVGTLGAASEVGRGVRSTEQAAGVAGDIGKGVGTAASAGSGVAAPGAVASSAPVAATARAAAPEAPVPPQRITPKPVAAPAAAPSQPTPVAVAKTPVPAVPAPAAGYTFSPSAQPKIPEPTMIEARTGSVEAVKSMGAPDRPDQGPGSTGLPETPKPVSLNTVARPLVPEPQTGSSYIKLDLGERTAPPPQEKLTPAEILRPDQMDSADIERGRQFNENLRTTDPGVKQANVVKGDPKLADLTDSKNTHVSPDQARTQLPKTYSVSPKPGPEDRVKGYLDRYQEAGKTVEQLAEVRKNLGKPLPEAYKEIELNEARDLTLKSQRDPLALKILDQRGDDTSSLYQQQVKTIRADTVEGIKAELAKKYGVSPDRVEVATMSNPKPEGVTTTPKDWDVTARIRTPDGRLVDIPPREAGPIVAKAYWKASGLDNVERPITPDRVFAEQQQVKSTFRLTDEAFESNPKLAERFMRTTEPVEDAAQIDGAIKQKFLIEQNKAIDLARKGNVPAAEVQRGLAMDQTVKEFDKHVKGRVEARGGEVHSKVEEGVNIMRKVGTKNPDGTVYTPFDAEVDLAKLGPRGETPRSITDKVASQIEAAQTLSPPGSKARVPDSVHQQTVTENVTGELARKGMLQDARAREFEGRFEPIKPSDLKSQDPMETGRFKPVTDAEPLTEGKSSFKQPGILEQAGDTVRSGIKAVQGADQQLAKTLSVGELAKDASQFRKTANFAGAAVGTGMVALSVADMKTKEYEGDRDISTAKGLRSQAQIAREKGHGDIAVELDRAAEALEKSGFEKKKEAAIDGAQLLGGMAVGAVAPTASTVVGGAVIGYAGGRYLMENTETGRWLENQKEDLYDGRVAEGLYQARLAVGDQVGGYLGDETEAQRKQREYQKRQETYLNALQDGRLQLQEGASARDLMDYIRYNDPTQPDYREGLNRLVARAPAVPPGGQGPTAPADLAAADGKADAPPAGGSGDVVSRALNQMIEEKPTAMEQYAGIDRDVKPVLPEGDTGIGADLIGKLRDAEGSTSAGLSIGGAGMGADTGLQLALGANVTGSVLQDRDQQLRQEAQQAWGSIAGAQNERAVAEQNRQASDNTRVQAQGQQANQAIAANAQEFSTAQQTLQVTRQNSLINVLVEAGMGGITSGTAVGINTFGTIVSSAMAQQISVNWGIAQPTPTVIPGTPSTAGTGSTGSQAGGGQTGSTSQASTSSTAASTTSPTVSTGSQTSGGQAVSPPQSPTRTANTSSGGTATTSRPPATSTSTGGTKSCRVAGTCYYTGFANKNGCCTVCGKKVAKK